MGAALPFVAAGMTAASTVSSMNQQQEQAQVQSETFANQAQAAATSNALDTANLQAQQTQAEGGVIASLGAAGVDPNSGTGVSDQGMTATNYARKIYADQFSTANTVNALNTSAQNAIINGQLASSNTLFQGASRIAQSGIANNMFGSSTADSGDDESGEQLMDGS